VAINVEQLLYRAPGGIARYTARLVTLLPVVSPDVAVVPFTARHSREAAQRAYRAFGLDRGAGTDPAPEPVRLPLPRPVLYDAWHTAGVPRLGWLSGRLGGCEVIHAPSLAVPPKGQARLVVTVHDVAPLLFPETFTPRGRWFHWGGIRAAARRADLVITGTEAAADEIVAHTAIARARIRVVLNGVDTAAATPAEVEAATTRWGLGDTPYVLWVGSLEPRKNVGVLVSAFARAVADGALPHRLVLAGPRGWHDDALLSRADRDALGDRLRLLGAIGHTEIGALYGGADLFAFPSRHEGFGLPVLEAMAQGTPVVCADIPSLREVAGGAARLVGADDVAGWAEAMRDLLGDRALRAVMGEAGRRRAASLPWEQTVRATRMVYQEAMA
jgi:glycosyltransferase involved in cell wall biosynthesis